jgi:hypothetical protein
MARETDSMRFLVWFRLDSFPTFTTDSYEFNAYSWEDAMRQVNSVEAAGNTVLELKRLNVA